MIVSGSSTKFFLGPECRNSSSSALKVEAADSLQLLILHCSWRH